MDGWGLLLKDGRTLVWPRPVSGNTPTPHTLQPGHSASWFVPVALLPLDDESIFRKGELQVRSFANLGTGTRATAKKEFTVARTVIEREAQKGRAWR